MSFDMNPADEDEHGECRHEIERLNAELAEAREIIASLLPSEKWMNRAKILAEMVGAEEEPTIRRARDFLKRDV